MSEKTIDEAIRDKRVIICGGSGGVGKTTLAAALGVHLAQQGKRAIVITIDPARRLADALGITMESDRVVEVRLPEGTTGSLYAVMLEPERAVRAFMAKLLPAAEQAGRIVNDRFFQQGMAMMAVSPEYLSMQELHDLSHSNEVDVIILDTPPTKQSIDFLTAPDRLARALQQKAVIVNLVKPYLKLNQVGFNLIKAGAKAILGVIDKIFGIETFIEFFTFFEACVTLLDLDGLEARIHKVTTLLRDPKTTFLVVAAPNPVSIEEALYFHGKIDEFRIAFGGFVINRVLPPVPVAPEAAAALGRELPAVAAELTGDLAAAATLLPKLGANLEDYLALRGREQHEIGRLAAVLAKGEFLTQVPRLEQDVHDLAGISQVAAALS